ncbi:class I SAM-dependent methyltransferase [Iamia sp. SCSIO 61187]|uniref:class I SAM-dependent methyltransferase n=1 Tax=Iamia sp. SCSIO 61187 TaxID=2722752 RepID=UPI001C635DFB|nr:class I SAM-dependent methyltransferase [Iamia sp. SCSIO 61187]QYG93257.1 class I SAM-dependent methyltransferase [Iamia sp. SCSIO 61187]
MTIDLSQRLCDATIGTLELFAVHLGTTLGLYEAFDRHGPLTAPELADRAGIDPRYAQEWCEQQAVAGYLEVASPSAVAETLRFALPEEHRGALLDPIDGDHLAPFASMVVGIAGVLDDVAEAFRTGGGVPYARYGATFRDGQGAINRPAFTSDLVKAWIPAVPGLTDRLAAGARVLDVGTGQGWSAIAIQTAWPAAQVVGLDTDAASIADARAHAAQAGVDVRFADPTASIADLGPVDAAFVLEALHDMSQPVEVLRALRQALTDDGVVVVVDEAVADAFTAPGDEVERMMYGWSVVHCLPASMSEEGSAALGTALRPSTVADLAARAGFSSCDVVDVDAGFFRVYRLAV